MTNQTFDHKLQQQLDALPNEQQPSRDLWRGIELALTEPQAISAQPTSHTNTPALRWLAVAATISFVSATAWFGGNHLIEQRAHDIALAQSQQWISALSEDHQQQKDSLLVALQGKAALTDNWQDQLQELEDAAQAIKEALEHDPRNPTLLKMLQSVYQQQMQLIERVHAPQLVQI